MSTRAIIKIFFEYSDDEAEHEICRIYFRKGGELEELGVRLYVILKDFKIVNKCCNYPPMPYAHDMGCLAAQLISILKEGPQTEMSLRPQAGEVNQDFAYEIREDKGKVDKNNGIGIIAGIKMRILDGDNDVIFNGPIADYKYIMKEWE
jgi:hypothetical protein